MKYLLFIFLALNISFISGCSSTLDDIAGVGKISSSKVSFDGSTDIELSMTRVYQENGKMMDTFLTGRWNSKTPDVVFLGLLNNSSAGQSDTYVSYRELKVRIDGIETSYKAGKTRLDNSGYNNVTNTIYTSSEASVVVPLEELKKMIKAEDVKIRVTTRDYYEDAIFQQNGYMGEESAQTKFKKFVTEIDKTNK